MKINTLETHDRLISLKKDQAINISQGIEDCLKKNSLSLALQAYSPYIYIFAHPRTLEDGATKVMYYQPRLTKPEAQTNSYLFRAQSNTDIVEVCWLLPNDEIWGQHKKGNVTESETVQWSIAQFKTNKKTLERPDPEDLSDEKIRDIYNQIKFSSKNEKLMSKLYGVD
jgi:hypothetical protein